MEYVLEVHNLTKSYKSFKALNNLNCKVPKGSIYGLIGKNGAGKTTLIRIICGLQKPTSGTYSFYGIKNTDSQIKNFQRRIGALIESPSIYNNLTAIDNLKVQFKLVGMPSFDGIDELLSLVNLTNTKNKKVCNFSLGMRQRLGIAMCLVGNPDFLILDEPINGLDPEGIVEIRELLLKLNKEKNITILISSHYLDELSKIATYYGFIDNGYMIKEISKENLDKLLQKRIILKVKKGSQIIPLLENMSISYQVIDDANIILYGDIDIQDLLSYLKNNNHKVLKVIEKDETLESYFMNLLGGDSND